MPTRNWTAKDIPNLTGKVVIITGANQGLGLETARALAERGAEVVLAIRTINKGEAAIKDIQVDHPKANLSLQRLDLASLDSIHSAADEIKARFDRIDMLVNNAGAMYTSEPETVDGFEMQLGTNHLGHFAWTGLLIERLIHVPESRIVTVSSIGHRLASKANFDNLQTEQRLSPPAAYNRSKLANLLFHYELQRRLTANQARTIAVATHPGLASTTLLHQPSARFLRPFMFWMIQSPEMGALSTLRAATDPAALGGQFYGPDGFRETTGYPKLVTSSESSYDGKAQHRLWAMSEEMTGVHYHCLKNSGLQ